jgi:hypothetical protein
MRTIHATVGERLRLMGQSRSQLPSDSGHTITNNEQIKRQRRLADESNLVTRQARPMKFEQDESSNLTVEQCEELATAIAEEAALLPPGSKKEELLKLAQSYRHLARMKSLIGRKLS